MWCVQKSGTVLKYLSKHSDQTESIVYRYLLLSTRLDMIKNKVMAGEDGTELLEHLAAHVLQQYLGGRARSFVFGTADRHSFGHRIRHLCTSLQEGIDAYTSGDHRHLLNSARNSSSVSASTGPNAWNAASLSLARPKRMCFRTTNDGRKPLRGSGDEIMTRVERRVSAGRD